MNCNVLLVGVGGQGILLAAKIISEAAELSGYSVYANETHGMAQRGGCVSAQIKFGTGVYSPLILQGTADVIGALEHIEAIRWAHYLKPDGLAVVSKQSLIPVTVSSGKASYPSDIEDRLIRLFPRLKYVDCVNHAIELGDARYANSILVGMVSTELPLEQSSWHEAIRRRVAPKTLATNIEAFELGH